MKGKGSKLIAIVLVAVEPYHIYPAEPLHRKYKGMRMTVGSKGMSPMPIDVAYDKLNTEFERELIEARLLCYNQITGEK